MLNVEIVGLLSDNGNQLEQITGLEKVGGRNGLSMTVRYGGESYLLLAHNGLHDLQTAPDNNSSIKSIYDALKTNTDLVYITGPMYSGKSEIVNGVLLEAMNSHVQQGEIPCPIVVGRANAARVQDSIMDLLDTCGALDPFLPRVRFHLGMGKTNGVISQIGEKIEGPMDFLRVVLKDPYINLKGLRLVVLEEAPMLLFSRADYIKKARIGIGYWLSCSGIPRNYWSAYAEIIEETYLKTQAGPNYASGFEQEIALMLKILKEQGIKVIMAGVDRFSSGDPWPPIERLTALTNNDPGIKIHQRTSCCVGCNDGRASISAISEQLAPSLSIGGVNYGLYQIFGSPKGTVENAEPYYAPLCKKCNDILRPDIPALKWPKLWLDD